MRRSRASLDEIRRLAGPSRARLDRLATRTAAALELASAAAAPAEGCEAHGLLKNAIQLASRAAERAPRSRC